MLYAVQITEHPQGGRANSNVVGIYGTHVAASIKLTDVFLEKCEEYGVDKELDNDSQVDTDCSYYNEGKDFSFDVIGYGGVVSDEVFGEICEIELNK